MPLSCGAVSHMAVNFVRLAAGLFIFAYCFYYYFARSDMSGFMQVELQCGNCALRLTGAT